MESLRKALKRTPKSSQNHEKIVDAWGAEKEPVRAGVKFYLEYLGSTLVEELEEGLSYGNKICSKAVKVIMDMSKSVKKQDKVEVAVSSRGIEVTDMELRTPLTSLNIYRIHFCTADKSHERVFAYIARSTENENMECHAFLCPKRKVAEAVTLTVAQAFQVAKEDYERRADRRDQQRLDEALGCSSNTSSPSSVSNSSAFPPTPTRPAAHSPSQPTSSPHQNPPVQGFEDSFTDVDIQRRSNARDAKTNPFRNSTFNTDVAAESLNEDLLAWLEQEDRSNQQRRQAPGDLIQL